MTIHTAIHTVYVGAQSGPRGFDASTPSRLAEDAREFFRGALSSPARLSAVCGLDEGLARIAIERVASRLAEAPIDDLRIDFEDGYAGSDEDADAVRVAGAVAEASRAGDLPPGIGPRIRSMADPTVERSRRTLDLFLGSLLEELDRLPEGFVVTLAKIDEAREIERLAAALDELERHHGLRAGSIPVELMAETPRSICDSEGRLAVPSFVAAARGRCVGIHFGIYDYTASLGLVAGQQRLRHPACDAARSALQIGIAGLNGSVELSDGSSRIVPRLDMGKDELSLAIRSVYDDVRHSLDHGIHRGWDMAGSHVAIRRVAVTAFYLEALPEMRRRWDEAFGDRPGTSEDLEDAATVRALHSFFQRGQACGALEDDEMPS